MPATQAPVSRQVQPTKHEAFVEQEIQRAVGRIRLFDILGALFGLAILTLGYGLGMILLDRWLEFPALVRQLAFGGFVIGAGLYLWFALVRPLLRVVNPYYAAKQVEQSLAVSKNSLMNYLDLREQKLVPAIKAAVGLRAAHDLKQTNLETAISGKHVLWRGGIATLLFVATLVVFIIFGPRQFLSLFQRTYGSWVFESAVLTRTTVRMVTPEGGHAVVPVNQSVLFVAHVGGRVPRPEDADAVKLLFRYSQDEPVYQERRLSRGDSDNEWTFRLPAFEVHNGFFYQIKAGDAETPEYQIQATAGPVVTDVEVTCTPPRYVHRPPQTSNERNLRELRGTQASLLVRTNRQVKEGRLFVEPAKQTIVAELVPGDPSALRFKLTLDQDGSYRIRFVTVEGEHSPDTVPYAIKIVPDLPPTVEWTDPKDEFPTVPANGTLTLKAAVQDDYGIADVRLQMRLKDGPVLKAKPYAGAKFRYDNGGCPAQLNYLDLFEPEKLQRADGVAQPVKPGDVVECWLEVKDNCEHPQANVGKSKSLKIKIGAPAGEQEKKEQQEQAKKDQKNHEDQELEKRQQENQQKKEEAKQQPSQEQNQGDSQSGEQKKQDQEAKNTLDKLQNQADKKPGETKPQPGEKGEKKDGGKQGGEQQGNEQKSGADSNKGDRKPEPKPQPGEEKAGDGAGDPKPGPQGGGQGAAEKKPDGGGQADPKTAPQQHAGQGEKGDAKPQPKEGGQGAGEDKGDNNTGQKPGESKTTGSGNKPSDKPGSKHSEQNATGQGEKGQGHADGKNGMPAKDDGKAPTGEARGDTSAGKGEHRGEAGDQPKAEAHGSASGDGPTSPKPGTAGNQKPGKPEAGGKDTGTVKGEPKDGQSPNAGSEKVNPNAPNRDKSTVQDVQNAAKQLKNGKPEDQVDADRFLQQVAQQAKDPKVREAAKEALKQAQAEGSGSQGDDPKNSRNTASGSSKDPNGRETPSASKTGSSKTGPNDNPKDNGTGTGGGQKTNERGDPNKTGPGSNSKGKDPGDKAPGDPAVGNPGGTPGGGTGDGNNPDPTAQPGDPGELEGSPADLANKKRAAELQLQRWDELKRKLTPDMLKKAGMTEDELRQFDQSYRDQLRQRIANAEEKLAAPQRGDSRLPGSLRRIDGSTTNPQDLNNGGKAQAPSEFRNAYQEFTQELLKLKPKK
ncbi:MAG: DUF4175 family protein [Planctomycetia bacterium]|nr:DUF4175 family protein [Planctomycetia bacterium]